MKETILIIHGINGKSGWQDWLTEQLTAKGYTVISKLLPKPNKPVRKEWLESVIEFCKDLDLSKLIIIGHSLGSTTAVDFIESLQEGKQVRCFISVSGFAEDYGSDLNSFFFEGIVPNYSKVISNSRKRIVIFGDNDPYVPQSTLKKFSKDIKADEQIIVEDGGHLSRGSGFIEFPLLLDLVEEN